jgi:protein involved in polysaccharide export with SLBB domain
MKNPVQSSGLTSRLAAVTALVALLWGLPAVAQRATNTGTPPIEPRESRADRAAEETVSLSADQIFSLLRTETGLLLEVKKALVRTAFEQGRLLDPQDLTDEALFRLIREDESVRVLVTREIVDRYYLRAKPTKDELRRGLVSEPLRGQAQSLPADAKRSQEEIYWLIHEGRDERYPERFPAPGASPSSSSPSSPSTPSSGPAGPLPPDFEYPLQPEQPIVPQPSDMNRQLQRTDLQQGDYPDTLNAGGMPQVSPEQMAQLLSASGTDRSSMLGDAGSMQSLAAMSALGAGGSAGLPNATPDLSAMRAPESVEPMQQTAQPQMKPVRTVERRPQQPELRHRPNPYADVPSLYDLYSQYSGRPANLQRFGADIFRNGTGNLERLPMDLPVGPEYVLGPGDGLRIELWGSVSQRLQRVVDRQGRVALPEVGAIEVAGKSLGEVQHLVQTTLRTQFRDVEADVSLSRLRSVRVYVVGDVQRAGAYDVSALSTPLNALYVAGGPTSGGSLRIIRHYRGKQLVQETDVYDLLLHGIRSDLQGLQPGDTLLVPPLGPEVTVEGMVRRPAVYELKGEKNLTSAVPCCGWIFPKTTIKQSSPRPSMISTFRMATKSRFLPSCPMRTKPFIWLGMSSGRASLLIATA